MKKIRDGSDIYIIGSIQVKTLEDAALLDALLETITDATKFAHRLYVSDDGCEAKYQFGIVLLDRLLNTLKYQVEFLDENDIWYITDIDFE